MDRPFGVYKRLVVCNRHAEEAKRVIGYMAFGTIWRAETHFHYIDSRVFVGIVGAIRLYTCDNVDCCEQQQSMRSVYPFGQSDEWGKVWCVSLTECFRNRPAIRYSMADIKGHQWRRRRCICKRTTWLNVYVIRIGHLYRIYKSCVYPMLPAIYRYTRHGDCQQ